MAETQQVSMDTVYDFMPFPKLTKCQGEPTYSEMAIIQKEIYQNFVTIVAPFGNGQADFLEVMMPEAYMSNVSMSALNHPMTPMNIQTIFPQMHCCNAGVSS